MYVPFIYLGQYIYISLFLWIKYMQKSLCVCVWRCIHDSVSILIIYVKLEEDKMNS